ncbi:N-alpha-acetyltransferase 20 isoform X2 [Balaenoptera ricei]|uniref:N-alpha-acetyltransferase 20 isoform X2 n=1 Tax=Balaenoptera ricei TaxID=2746895 RepID=UPI0028BEC776|nr:N-alpha-acetyltransferase 20 isoform X2 [Balaenoptera ricei]
MSLEWMSSPGGSVTSPATRLGSGTTLPFPGVPGVLPRWLRAYRIPAMFLAGGSTEGKYLAHWPEYFIVAEAPGGELMGYIMGKAEGSVAREEWHGHVTALSVAPEFRRLGLAAKLMELLEEISERDSTDDLPKWREELPLQHRVTRLYSRQLTDPQSQRNCSPNVKSFPCDLLILKLGMEGAQKRKGGFFVDLFVRVSNQVAVNMYKQLGYSVYRTVIEYYSASNGEPDEDAYDMRKALSRDTEKKSIIPLPHPVRPEDIE